tara:strand:- start:1077 stop:1541 length:465 start_codon:yes stop_codon:yes gene_type:complete
MKVEKLTKYLAEKNIKQLLDLEVDYSENDFEHWNESQMLKDLPHKWEYSSIGYEGDTILGYVMVSKKEVKNRNSCAFVHRIFVPSERPSLLLLLMRASLRRVKLDGITQARWNCARENSRVYNFYKRFSDGILGERTENRLKYSLFYKDLSTLF